MAAGQLGVFVGFFWVPAGVVLLIGSLISR